MKNDLYELLNAAHSGHEDSTVELYLRFSKLIKKLSTIANYEEAETYIIIFLLEFIVLTKTRSVNMLLDDVTCDLIMFLKSIH